MKRRPWGSSLVLLVLLSFAAAGVAQSSSTPAVVDLTSGDGTVLKASYFAAAKPGPGVILFHQCNQDRTSWNDLAMRLAGAGINVLTVDYRGFGESSGPRFDRLPVAERQQLTRDVWPGDMDKAFEFLVSQPGVKREVIGAGGASCGVNQSIQLARRHPEIKSLVLLSGPTDRNGRQFVKSAAKLPLFGSAADDDGGAVVTMEWILGLSPNEGTRFEHYKTGGHGTEMFAPHNELPGMIVDWYTTTLIKTPGKAPAPLPSARVSKNALAMLDQPDGVERAAEILESAQKSGRTAEVFPEQVVNVLGYEHMQNGDVKGAIEILKLNAKAYPKSANTYDSLSDAYLADGQRELALTNARKCVEMLASDTIADEQKKAIRNSAEQKIKQLESKH